MPTGPQGQHRPADVIGCAVKVARIATGEIEDGILPAPKEAGIVGASGGQARSKKLTPKRRSEIARQAAQARWAAHKEKTTKEGSHG